MTTRRRISTALLVPTTAAALLLAGCTVPATDDPTDPAPTASPSEPAEASSQPTLDELNLLEVGIGEVRIGEPVPTLDDPTAASVVYDEDACAIDGTAPAEGTGGIWYGAYPDAADLFGNVEPPFYLTTDGAQRDAAVTAIIVNSGVHTADGIELGSARDEVEALRSGLQLTEGPLSDTYSSVSTAGSLVIEVAKPVDGQPDYWTPEQVDTVIGLRALAPGLTAEPVAGTDAFSPCPV